jgi:predicted 2-oxoglutarate/Fe(II)-dependent dioxygenase YbiX
MRSQAQKQGRRTSETLAMANQPLFHSGRVFSTTQVERVLADCGQLSMRPAEVYGAALGTPGSDHVRRGSTAFLPSDHWASSPLERFAIEVNALNWGYKIAAMQPAQVARYQTGDYFSWHHDVVDAGAEPNAPASWRGLYRVLTIVVALSDPAAYVGGNLLFRTSKRSRNIATHTEAAAVRLVPGHAAIFPSGVFHCVAPIDCGERLSLTAWFLGTAPVLF